MRFVVRRCAVILTIALLAGACGGGGGVGGDLKVKKGQGGSGAIQQATTTTLPTTTTGAHTATTAGAATTVPQQPSAVYNIQNDTKGQYIDPLSHSVRAGSLVRFVNQDSEKPHQITLKLGGAIAMQSPMIATGGTWDVKPTARGTYDIVDEQRPYAQGATLTVG
jgi:plastocyanin